MHDIYVSGDGLKKQINYRRTKAKMEQLKEPQIFILIKKWQQTEYCKQIKKYIFCIFHFEVIFTETGS